MRTPGYLSTNSHPSLIKIALVVFFPPDTSSLSGTWAEHTSAARESTHEETPVLQVTLGCTLRGYWWMPIASSTIFQLIKTFFFIFFFSSERRFIQGDTHSIDRVRAISEDERGLFSCFFLFVCVSVCMFVWPRRTACGILFP